jgi:hypothetical protein
MQFLNEEEKYTLLKEEEKALKKAQQHYEEEKKWSSLVEKIDPEKFKERFRERFIIEMIDEEKFNVDLKEQFIFEKYAFDDYDYKTVSKITKNYNGQITHISISFNKKKNEEEENKAENKEKIWNFVRFTLEKDVFYDKDNKVVIIVKEGWKPRATLIEEIDDCCFFATEIPPDYKGDENNPINMNNQKKFYDGYLKDLINNQNFEVISFKKNEKQVDSEDINEYKNNGGYIVDSITLSWDDGEETSDDDETSDTFIRISDLKQYYDETNNKMLEQSLFYNKDNGIAFGLVASIKHPRKWFCRLSQIRNLDNAFIIKPLEHSVSLLLGIGIDDDEKDEKFYFGKPKKSNTKPKKSNTKPKKSNTKPKKSNTKPKKSNAKPKKSNTKPKKSNTKPKKSRK